MQVETLHDKPVAVPSLMEKFLVDLCIIILHVVQIPSGGAGGGNRFDPFEGYGSQAVYSGIGYLSQRDWV